MSVSEAGLVFSFFALIMFLLSPVMGSLVRITCFEYLHLNLSIFDELSSIIRLFNQAVQDLLCYYNITIINHFLIFIPDAYIWYKIFVYIGRVYCRNM